MISERTTIRPAQDVCLVHSPCLDLRDDRLEPPLGLLYLATVVRAAGHAVHLIDLSACTETDLASHIPDDCDVYGFSTFSVNYALTRVLMTRVRERNPRAWYVAGGPHADALPQAVACDGFDTVVTGEGENAILEILGTLQSGQQPPRVLAGRAPDPLDQLPFPDYSLVDLASYSRQLDGEPCVSVLSSRGCPYKCSFCNSKIMGGGTAMRFRSPENVVAEIRELKSKYDLHHFRFQDDIFTINPSRIAELTPFLEREDILYRCFARINTCARHIDVLENLKRSGCIHISFGVETGSPKLLARHAMHKSQTQDEIRLALENAAEVGIRTRIFLIVGFPGETDDTVDETIALLKACPWDEFSVYPLIAYPGTPIHDNPEHYGVTFIDRNYSDYIQIGRNYRAGFTIRTADFDETKVRHWRDHVRDELVADGRTWAGDAKGFK